MVSQCCKNRFQFFFDVIRLAFIINAYTEWSIKSVIKTKCCKILLILSPSNLESNLIIFSNYLRDSVITEVLRHSYKKTTSCTTCILQRRNRNYCFRHKTENAIIAACNFSFEWNCARPGKCHLQLLGASIKCVFRTTKNTFDQTHSNNSRRIVWVCLTIFKGSRLQ